MGRALLLAVFFAALLSPVSSSWSNNHWATLLPAGDGQQETKELCGSCHNLQKIVLSRKTPQEWERSVFDMVARGAQIFPDEVEKIVKYLSENFNLNKPAN